MTRIDPSFRKGLPYDGGPRPAPPQGSGAKKPKLTRQRRKTISEDAEYNALRDIYLEQNPLCMWCRGQATEVHHILRGKYRRHGLRNPLTWLAVCRRCHDVVDGFNWDIQASIQHLACLRTIERLRK